MIWDRGDVRRSVEVVQFRSRLFWGAYQVALRTDMFRKIMCTEPGAASSTPEALLCDAVAAHATTDHSI